MDIATGGAVFGQLNLARSVSGLGQSDNPYILSSANDVLLLAAAINTLHSGAMRAFSYPGGIAGNNLTYSERVAARDHLLQAQYLVTETIDLTNRGFLGIGYLHASRNLVFSGTFSGLEIVKPSIQLDMRSSRGSLGLFVAVSGAEFRHLVLDGSIQTSGSTVGALAAHVGVVGMDGNQGITVHNVSTTVTIQASSSGRLNLGGLIGYADRKSVV